MKCLLFLLGLMGLVAAHVPRDADGSIKGIRRVEPHMNLSKRQQTCYVGPNVFIPPHGNSDDADLLTNTLNEIGTLMPGSTYTIVPYNTSQSANNSINIRDGQTLAIKMIRAYLTACPDSTVALLGLSEGAIVAMNTICGYRYAPTDQFPAKYHKNLVGVVGYGDESFVPNKKYDYGTCTGQGSGQGPSLNPRPNWRQCNKFGHLIQDYCDMGDPDCCNGTNPLVHTGYDGTYYQQAGNFIYNHFQVKQPKLNGK